MTLSDLKQKRRGRPSIEEIPLPPHVQRALVLRGNGSSWKDAAESVRMDYRTLRKYVRDHPDANNFLERQPQDALDQSHSRLIAAAPLSFDLSECPKPKAGISTLVKFCSLWSSFLECSLTF